MSISFTQLEAHVRRLERRIRAAEEALAKQTKLNRTVKGNSSTQASRLNVLDTSVADLDTRVSLLEV